MTCGNILTPITNYSEKASVSVKRQFTLQAYTLYARFIFCKPDESSLKLEQVK